MHIGPLGMPLDGHNEMLARVQLNRLDHPIFGRNRAYQKIVPRNCNRLMMTRIHVNGSMSARWNQTRKSRARSNFNCVRIHRRISRGGLDRSRQMLSQRAVAPDIQVLDSEANAEDWLM